MNNLTIAYLNGTFVPLNEAQVPAMDRGFLFGDSVYEVLPAYNGKIFSFAEHYARLIRSLDAIKLSTPHTADELPEMEAAVESRLFSGTNGKTIFINRNNTVTREQARNAGIDRYEDKLTDVGYTTLIEK